MNLDSKGTSTTRPENLLPIIDNGESANSLPQPSIAIIVPVHNRLDLTKRFLDHFRIHAPKKFKVVVIDDGSTDGTSDWIRRHHHEVHIISANGNEWWAGATNLGVKWALDERFHFILTINNDGILCDDYYTQLANFASRRDFTTVIGSRLMWGDRPDRIWSLGTRALWSRNRLWEHIDQGTPWESSAYSGQHFVTCDTLCGNGTLIPANVFRHIGLYDAKALPQYHADADFCLRAARAGYQIITNTALVIHNDPHSSTQITRIWWSISQKASPLYLPALLTILWRWCPLQKIPLLLIGQYLPVAFPFLRRRGNADRP